jgi:transcriptional regulator with XRE-family HTH domain
MTMDTQPSSGIAIPARVIDDDFGGWLRDGMAERGMTTRSLAMRTGINHTSISRLMRNQREPSLSTAVALIRILEAPLRRVWSTTAPAEHRQVVATRP